MYYHGHKFRINKLDEMRKTCNSRISAVFEVSNILSRNDTHLQQSKNWYYEILDDILECDFNSFKLDLFVIKWYRLLLNWNDPDRTFIEHDSGFTIINIRSFELIGDEPYVRPSQCEQVFYFGIPHKLGWSFVVIHNLRGRLVKYNVMDEEDTEESKDKVNDDHEQLLHNDDEEEDDDSGDADDDGDDDGDHDHGD